MLNVFKRGDIVRVKDRVGYYQVIENNGSPYQKVKLKEVADDFFSLKQGEIFEEHRARCLPVDIMSAIEGILSLYQTRQKEWQKYLEPEIYERFLPPEEKEEE